MQRGKKLDIHKIQGFFKRAAENFVIPFRNYILCLIVCLFAVSIWGMQKVRMDSSNEAFFAENDQTLIINQQFKETFGNEEFIFILIEAENVFSSDVLNSIKTISEDIKSNLPFVNKVTSLVDIEYSYLENDSLYIKNLIPDHIPTDRQQLQDIKEKALSKKIYSNRILTDDGKKTAMFITFTRIPNNVYLPVEKGFTPLSQTNWPVEKVIMKNQVFLEREAEGQQKNLILNKVADPRKLISPALSAILSKYKNAPHTVKPIGVPLIDFELDRITEVEIIKFGLISLAISGLLLLILFFSFNALVAPLFICLTTVVVLFGLMGFMQFTITMTSILIPSLIVVISVSYSIHFIGHYQRKYNSCLDKVEAIVYSFEHVGWPCFLTALTTAFGFASFAVVPIRPIREVGFICSIGVLLAFFLMLTVVPFFFLLGKKNCSHTSKEVTKNPIFEAYMLKWANLINKKSKIIIAAFIAIMVILLALIPRLKVKTDFLIFLGDRIPVVQQTKEVTSKLGGLYSYEIVIDLPAEGMAKEPQVIRGIDSLTSYLDNLPSTKLVISLSDILQDINLTYNGGKYQDLKDRKEVAQYLLLYEMASGEDLEDWVDNDFKKLRISVQTDQISTDMHKNFDKIKILASEYFPEGTEIIITGDMSMMLNMAKIITNGQIQSVLLAFVVILGLLIIILSSVSGAFISMIPNIFPVICILGIMGLLNIPLDMLTMMISAVIIGIAVDDTIHFVVNFKQEFENSNSYTNANRSCFYKVGRAITFTSVILFFGFGIIGFSEVKSLQNYAIFSSIGILSALLADFLITPALLIIIKPFGKKTKRA